MFQGILDFTNNGLCPDCNETMVYDIEVDVTYCIACGFREGED